MDPLAILTRSAKPTRKRPASESARTPSKGPTRNPQLYPQVSFPEQSGRKRKRGSDGHDAAHANGINFFGDAGQQHEAKVSEAVAEDTSDDDAITAATSGMEIEERKRILKQHKLKIAIIGSEAQATGKSEKQKKKKRKEDQQEKTDSKHAGQLYPEPLVHFRQLRPSYGVSTTLARNIADQSFTLPTEVQMASLPLLLHGIGDAAHENEQSQDSQATDLLTVAPTGSGKTLAFLIPLLHSLQSCSEVESSEVDTTGPKAVILAPTKELVNQIVNEGRKLAVGMSVDIAPARKGLKLSAEGTDIEGEADSRRVPDIVVATPGSLIHLLEGDEPPVKGEQAKQQQNSISPLPSIKHLILDEADVLLDPLFKSQTLSVYRALTSPSLRISLWSATISSTIETELRTLITKRHARIPNAHPAPLVRLVVGLKDSAVPNIMHKLTYCATERGKLLALRDLLVPKSVATGPALRAPFLVFTQTIERCTALHNELKYDIPVSAGGSSRIAVLHSELPDRVRDRILTNFRKGEIWVLITTDLLARGVDFRGVNGVVNYDVPTSAAGYVHRVGRTGRAGREGGVAVTLYTKEDVRYVKVVANVIAAAEKARGKDGEGEKSVEQWLLDALPDVSKEDRKRLKKRGVEERRKGRKEGRIDTRSGYVRKEQNRRRDIVKASRRARDAGQDGLAGREVTMVKEPEDDGDFGGFSD